MWHSHSDYNDKEKEILRELEYDLFMVNPGFRAMWQDDFGAYFAATFDQELWNKRESERDKELEANFRRRMVEDPEFARWQHELAYIEEAVMGIDPILARGRKFEVDTEDIDDDEDGYEKDSLYIASMDWGKGLSRKTGEIYEKEKYLPLFRISVNASYVPSKIVFASGGRLFEEEMELEWRTDRIGYMLALTFLDRCLDSLPECEKYLGIDHYLEEGKQIRRELVNRLDEINQLHWRKKIK